MLNTMYAISPLDGRYHKIGEELSTYFSEFALVKNRVKVEIKWLIFLLENLKCNSILEKNINSIEKINKIYEEFDEKAFKRIKEIEYKTNHDVKAVEMYIGEELKRNNLEDLISFVHFGCTSEDINNTSYAMMIKEGLYNVWIKEAEALIKILKGISIEYKNMPMLAHTHGQPASPTTVGKEIAIYYYRLNNTLELIKSNKIQAKFNGATGTYAAASIAFPGVDWQNLSKKFIEEYLKLEFNPLTTQIESYDSICLLFDYIRHFNNIISDLDVDMWLYISMNYFKQIVVKEEVGSSTMPHKVNPIRFENSESNIDMSNAILIALSNKLSKSRMQRDLSDSSSKRNIGMAIGYSLQAVKQTIDGLNKIQVNTEKIEEDLNNRWEVIAEPIQTMLRKYGMQDAYNNLKELTRGKIINKDIIYDFICSLNCLSEEDRKILLELTPSKYTGLSDKIVEDNI